MRLSVIIPTLNEADCLAATVERVQAAARRAEPPELIVADCRSPDGTAALARELGLTAVKDASLDSRAAAVNRGADVAAGDVLLALDADTLLPEGYDAAIEQALADPAVVGGAFEFAFDSRRLFPRMVNVINRVRYRISQLYYGDQGVFVRAWAFREVGGYPPMKVMESAAFCRRLRRVGKLTLVPQTVVTSFRRLEEAGVLRVAAKDVWIWLRFVLGASMGRWGEDYVRFNRSRGQAG